MKKDDITKVMSHFSWHFKLAMDSGKDWHDAWEIAMNKTMNSEELLNDEATIHTEIIQHPKATEYVKVTIKVYDKDTKLLAIDKHQFFWKNQSTNQSSIQD